MSGKVMIDNRLGRFRLSDTADRDMRSEVAILALKSEILNRGLYISLE